MRIKAVPSDSGIGPNTIARRLLSASLILLYAQFLWVGCKRAADSAEKQVEPVYDRASGKLQLLKYDSDGDGQTDIWTYTDGARVIRTEMDTNRDGKVDRWEYYGADRRIEKLGLSTQNDGKQDRWIYVGPGGTTIRVESSPRHDGKVGRVEHFENGVLTRAEEDTDGDGRFDKWETFDGARLAVVAFDTAHRGIPDRRLVYDLNGNVKVEVDARGDGHYVPVDQAASSPEPRPAR